MIHLIHSEVIKFRSVRSTVVVLACAVGITVVFALVQANDLSGGSATIHLGDINAGASISAFLFGALGVQVIGQEYRFNTIRTTFAAAPIRWRVLLAKLAVVVGACALAALTMMLVCVALGYAIVDNFELDGLDQRLLWGTVLFAAGWSAMGLGVGAIVRQPIAGILILLGEGFVAEPIVVQIFKWTAPWLPFLNGAQMMSRSSQSSGDMEFRSVLGGGIYLFVVTAIALAVGAVLANRRDA